MWLPFMLLSLAVVAVAERIVRLVRHSRLYGSWRRRHGYVWREDPSNAHLSVWVKAPERSAGCGRLAGEAVELREPQPERRDREEEDRALHEGEGVEREHGGAEARDGRRAGAQHRQ